MSKDKMILNPLVHDLPNDRLVAHPDEPFGRDPGSRMLHQISDHVLKEWCKPGRSKMAEEIVKWLDGLHFDGDVWVTAAMKPGLVHKIPSRIAAVVNFGIYDLCTGLPQHRYPIRGRPSATARLMVFASRHHDTMFSVRNGRGECEDSTLEQEEVVSRLRWCHRLFSVSWLSPNIPVGAGTMHGYGGTVPLHLFSTYEKFGSVYGYDELILNSLTPPTWLLTTHDMSYSGYCNPYAVNILNELPPVELSLGQFFSGDLSSDVFIQVCRRASVAASRPTATPWYGLGSRLIQGLPGYDLANTYRGRETSILRQPNNTSLHWLRLPRRLPDLPLSAELLAVVHKLNDLAAQYDGKIAITANPDGPPPPATLGFCPVAINGNRADWVNLALKVDHPRQNATARLLVMLAESVTDYWILNGREVEQQVLPNYDPQRLVTFNRGDLCPLVLASTRGSLRFPSDKFMAYWLLSFAYGVDEYMLKDYPLTCYSVKEAHPKHCWIWPQDQGWPDARIYAQGKLFQEGVINRLTTSAKFASTIRPPLKSKLPWALSELQHRRMDHIESTFKELSYIDDPITGFEGKDQTLLVVAYGTRGDIVPMEYIARVIQSMGIPVKFFVLRKITAEELRAIVSGHIWGRLREVVELMCMGKLGFKAVLSPQFTVPGNAASFELTPWEYTDPIQTGKWLENFLLNSFIKFKQPALKIGHVIGSNTPRSTDGWKRLRTNFVNGNLERIGWVAGSDGIEGVPEWIRSYEQITDPDHAGKAFAGFTHVWCNGGQGIRQTLRARGIIDLCYAPGFDRTLTLPNEPEFLHEPDFAAIVQTVEALGFQLDKSSKKSWSTTLSSMMPRFDKYSWINLVRLVVFIHRLWSLVLPLSITVASVPEILALVRAGWFSVPMFALTMLYRFPILTTFFGPSAMFVLWALFQLGIQLSKTALSRTQGTFLCVKFDKKFPYVGHMSIRDLRRGEMVHLEWQGNRRNLVNPFRGMVRKVTGSRPSGELWIPVPINYPSVVRQLESTAGRYSPWFNCHTVLPKATDYDLTVLAFVLLGQLLAFPLTMSGYIFWMVSRKVTTKWMDLPADDFFRYGTLEEYDKLQDDLDRQQRELQDHIAKVNLTSRALAADMTVEDLVTSDAQAITDRTWKLAGSITYVRDTDVGEVVVTADEIQANLDDVVLKAIDEDLSDPEPPGDEDERDFKALIDLTVDLIQSAKQEGIPEDEAYHAGILSLRAQILAFKKPQQVNEWITKHSPRVRTTFSEILEALADFLRYNLGPANFGTKAFQELYRWLEGIGAKAKLYIMRIWDVLDYVGELACWIGNGLWEAFSIVARKFIDWAFRGKLNKRMKSVWALGGVAKNPKMSAQKRMQEAIAFHQYTKKGFFEDEWRKMTDNLRSHLPPSYLPNDHPDRRFPTAVDENGNRIVGPLKYLSAPSDVAMGGHQYRQVGIPRLPVVNESEKEILERYGWTGRLLVDVERTKQVNEMLERKVKACLDGAYKVAIDPNVMADMSKRYAYYGLDYDPTKELIPPVLDDAALQQADEVAYAMYKAYPEQHRYPKLTHEHSLMRYYEWQRRIGSPYERHYRQRWEAWRAGVGYQVLKEVERERSTGIVEKAAFGSFAKSQPVPADKKPRSVTFMTVTRWFKEMTEQFSQNMRFTWKTTGVGKNMPMNQHMAEFFRQVRQMDIKFESDATEADSRFEAKQSEIRARLAWYGWTDASLNGVNLASMKRSKLDATQDGWIFNLHMEKGRHIPKWMKPLMHHPNAKTYSNVSDKRRGGATGLSDTTDLNTWTIKGALCCTMLEYCQRKGIPFTAEQFFEYEDMTEEIELPEGGTKSFTRRVGKYCDLKNTGDDNMHGFNLKRLCADLRIDDQEFDLDEYVQCARLNQLDLTILRHEDGRWLEYLSKFCRPVTVADRRAIARTEALYRERGIFGPDDYLRDPLTGGSIKDVVYQNLKSPMSKQTAMNAYKEQKFRDRYLRAFIERDAGHMALCAFVPEFYLQCQANIVPNIARYLAAAAFPDSCTWPNGLPKSAQGDELDWIMSHIQVKQEHVGQSMPVVTIDGNIRKLPASLASRHGRSGLPDEFRRRLQEMKHVHIPKYSKVIADHFAVQKKGPDYLQRLMTKLDKGIYGWDEGGKQLVESMREWFEGMPRKLTRGLTSTIDMVYPDELWQTKAKIIEKAIYATAQEELPQDQVVSLAQFSRLINVSPYAGACDAVAAFHEFNTPEGRADLNRHPAYVYRNHTYFVSIMYGLSWYVERAILGTLFFGLAYSVLMWYQLDLPKVYAWIGLLFWHARMRQSLTIAGLLPRDIYIWSKRFCVYCAAYVPVEMGYLCRFDVFDAVIADSCEWVAIFMQHGLHITPQTSVTSPFGKNQNPWNTVAHQVYAKFQSSLTKVVSLSGATGTGKSTWFIYDFHRINDCERGGDVWISAPRKILRDDWGLPSWMGMGTDEVDEASRKYQRLKGGIQKRENARIYLVTHGHLVNRIQKGEVKANDVVFFDESHEGSGPMIQAQDLLIKSGIWVGYLSATPAPIKGVNFGELIDSSPYVKKLQHTKTVSFPAKTPVIDMFQQARNSFDKDPLLGYSHRELTQRTIIKVSTLKEVQQVLAGLDELRKGDPGIPKAMEFSGPVMQEQRLEREAMLKTGSYILVSTDIINAGYDAKPPAYLIVDNSLTMQQHEGFLLRPAPSTSIQKEQLHGRTGRNSSDRPGLVYHTEEAGTGQTCTAYPSGAYFAEEVVANAYSFPWLKPLPFDGHESWNHFSLRHDLALSEPARYALRFVFYAAMSGVGAHQIKDFYFNHCQMGRPLSEDYEWMSAQIGATSRPLRLPHWDAVFSFLERNPYIVNTSNVEGAQPWVDGCSTSSLIYPVSRGWMKFNRYLSFKGDVAVRGEISDEGKLYAQAKEVLDKENKRLEDEIFKLRNKQGPPGSKQRAANGADIWMKKQEVCRLQETAEMINGRIRGLLIHQARKGRIVDNEGRIAHEEAKTLSRARKLIDSSNEQQRLQGRALADMVYKRRKARVEDALRGDDPDVIETNPVDVKILAELNAALGVPAKTSIPNSELVYRRVDPQTHGKLWMIRRADKLYGYLDENAGKQAVLKMSDRGEYRVVFE
uniref:ORF3 n=1 Tax=Monilinia hypovirus A TaxID=2592772 RepID=A0A7G3W8U7_9VIRU|nr:ORF3 [Monilinia hypovirus A]